MILFRWFIIAGALTGFLIALFLLYQKRDRNYYLSGFLIGFSYFLISPEIIRSSLESFPHVVATSFPLLFVFGPFLYIYAHKLARSQLSFRIKILHCAPVLLAFVYFSPFYLKSSDFKIQFVKQLGIDGPPLDFKIIWAIAIVHILFYTGRVKVLLSNLNWNLKKRYSNLEQLKLDWLQKFVTSNIVLWSLYFIGSVLLFLNIDSDPWGITDQLLGIFGAFMVYLLGFYVLSQPELIVESLEREQLSHSKHHLINKDRQKELLVQLESYMIRERPFLNPDLSLNELAKLTDIKPRQLSEIINTTKGVNFYDFINTYRLKEAKRLLICSEFNHYTINAIAYDAGFRSKSTFNKFFRQNERESPSEFRKRNTVK